ncbi:MAG TPA: hypothetical protein VNO55_26995, partial [Polyangia bacterium]|nr:hypothetical protein [Polyangia bacterium]
MASKRLGEILLAARPPVVAGGPVGGLSPEVIEQALQTQTTEGGRIGEILIKMRAVTEEDVLQALGRQLGIAYRADVKADEIDVELTTHVPIGFAKQHRMLVMRK